MKMRWCKCGINPRNGRRCRLPYGEDEFHVEEAEVRFAGEMLEIYRPYVEHTAISFETEPPTLDEFERRVKATHDAHYPCSWPVSAIGLSAMPMRGRSKSGRRMRGALKFRYTWLRMRIGRGMDGGSIRHLRRPCGHVDLQMPTPALRIRIGAIRISHGRACASIPRWDSGASGSSRIARRSLAAFIPWFGWRSIFDAAWEAKVEMHCLRQECGHEPMI